MRKNHSIKSNFLFLSLFLVIYALGHISQVYNILYNTCIDLYAFGFLIFLLLFNFLRFIKKTLSTSYLYTGNCVYTLYTLYIQCLNKKVYTKYIITFFQKKTTVFTRIALWFSEITMFDNITINMILYTIYIKYYFDVTHCSTHC